MNKTLYKLDSKNKVREWNINVSDDGIITILSGLKDGKKVTSSLVIKEGKNIGKANETSIYQQAINDATSKINAQLNDGYVEDVNNLKANNIKLSGCLNVMLAETYNPDDSKKTLSKYKLDGVKVGIQRKYDGVRRISKCTTDGVELYSRQGHLMDTVKHIQNNLSKISKILCENLGVDEIWLDGELYTDKLTFNKINGLTRKNAESLDEIMEEQLIQYHIYDYVSPKGYLERTEILDLIMDICEENNINNINIVSTKIITANPDTLLTLRDEYISENYEGLMIRTLNAPYEHKRSKSLLKYKFFDDAEFLCIDVVEGNIEGRCATLKCKLAGDLKDRSGNPIEYFYPTLVCSVEQSIWALQNPNHFIGKMVTVNYMGLSEYGVPRHCRVKDVRYDI